MAKIDFPKKQEQRLIPKYLLEYSEELHKNHPDPSAEWGSSGTEYTAGNGIEINEDVISIDDTVVATKNDIPDVSEFITDDDLSQVLEDYELKSEAFSGSYNDLTDKPTIPTKTSDLQNDSGYITGVTWNDVTGKPTFATVATSGDYDDLTDKPDLSVYELKSEAFSGDYTDLTNKPDLSVYELKSEAFSGNYNDLTNKPTIPTVNNNTITITQGGVTKGSFTLNQNTNQTIALDAGGSGPGLQNNSITGLVTEATSGSNKPSISISDFTATPTTYKLNLPEKNGTVATLDDIPTVPTKTSDLTNDSGFITGITSSMVTSALGYTPGTSNFSGDYDDLTNKPTIPVVPTNVSAFNNDAGYITSSALSNYVTTNTNQDITGVKTFTGSKKLLLKPSTSSDKPGFTTYLSATKELGFLESKTSDKLLTIGVNISNSSGDSNNKVAFRYYSGVTNTTYNLIAPDGSSKYTAIGSGDKYIPIAFTNGTTTVESSAGGLVDLSSLMPTVPTKTSDLTNDSGFITDSVSTLTNYYNKTYIDNTIGDIETLLAAI